MITQIEFHDGWPCRNCCFCFTLDLKGAIAVMSVGIIKSVNNVIVL